MILIRLNRLVASTINKLGLTQRIDKLIPLKGILKLLLDRGCLHLF